MALFTVTIKVGALASIGSVLLHIGILHLPLEHGIGMPTFRTTETTLIGAAIFPFMGCLSAAATLGR
jgi:hypothetical protein